MHLMAQVYAPVDGLDRTLYVFGCNKGTCSDHFGSFLCLRDQLVQNKGAIEREGKGEKEAIATDKICQDWGGDDGDDGWGDDGGWGGASDDENDGGGDVGMKDIEAMLRASEIGGNKMSQKKENAKESVATKVDSMSDSCNNGFMGLKTDACFLPRRIIELYNEPVTSLCAKDDHDEDLVGAASNDTKNEASLQRMLQKYLEEEEDADLVASIRQTSDTQKVRNSEGSAGRNGERDERLPASMRAFMAFTDRVKLSPSQVGRYAYGGEPMWSTSIASSRAREKQKSGNSKSGKFPTVPSCICGEERVFEFQLMPSLLHVLSVDDCVQSSRKSDDLKQLFSRTNCGMSWGVIAIYSCPSSCNDSSREYVVVQGATDGTPGDCKVEVGNEKDDDNN